MSSASQLRVVVTRKLPAACLARLNALPSARVCVWESEEPMPRAELLASLRDVGDDRSSAGSAARVEHAQHRTALICTLSDAVDAEVLGADPALVCVSTLSVGYSHVDIPTCVRRGVHVGYTPGALTETTADLVLALMLATARRVPEAASAVRDGSWSAWKPFWMCGKDLYGARVGIVGMGRIGVRVAARLRGFDCKIAYTGRSGRKPDAEAGVPGGAEFLSLEELLRTSDFVVLLCALTPETRNLMNAERLRLLKPDAVLINAARGEVVDQDALITVLRERPTMSAGLDVTTPEPLPTDHELLRLPNCVVLPHIGSASTATRTTMAEIAVENAIRGLQGEALLHEVPETKTV